LCLNVPFLLENTATIEKKTTCLLLSSKGKSSLLTLSLAKMAGKDDDFIAKESCKPFSVF